MSRARSPKTSPKTSTKTLTKHAARPVAQKQLLTDVQRLPLVAATDMLALSLQSEAHCGPAHERELMLFIQRLNAETDDTVIAGPALKILAALAAVGPIAGLSSAAVRCAVELVQTVLVRDHGAAEGIATLVLSGSDQFSSAVVGGLVNRQFTSESLAGLKAAVQRWLSEGHVAWRESAPATGRDVLIDEVCARLAEAGQVDAAQTIALQWPPTRSRLQRIVRVLIDDGRFDAIVTLAARLADDGLLHRALVETVVLHASTPSQTEFFRPFAEALWQLDPQIAHAAIFARGLPTAMWQARREVLVSDALNVADNPDAVAALSDPEPDIAALVSVIERYPGRGRAVQAALAKLAEHAPQMAFEALAAWLMNVCAAWPSLASAARIRKAIDGLHGAAKRIGEPALSAQFVTALRANHTEPSLLAALK